MSGYQEEKEQRVKVKVRKSKKSMRRDCLRFHCTVTLRAIPTQRKRDRGDEWLQRGRQKVVVSLCQRAANHTFS